MLTELILSLIFLLAPLFIVKSMMPNAYAFGMNILRLIWRLILWMLFNILNLSSPEDRRRRGAERYVPKGSKRR